MKWFRLTQKTKEHLGRISEEVAVSIVVAAVISAVALTYFEGRLENSKTHAEMLLTTREHFDSAHNEVLMQFGLYANKLLDQKYDPSQRDRIFSAVINAQSQLLEMRTDMGGQYNPAIASYAELLNRFDDSVRRANRAEELGPAYHDAQKLLLAKDTVDDSIKSAMTITAF